MLPTEDQKRLKLHSKVKKGFRAGPLKAIAWLAEIVGFAVLALSLITLLFYSDTIALLFFAIAGAAFLARWWLLIKAASVYGPHLGDDPGRARKATDDDLRAAGLF